MVSQGCAGDYSALAPAGPSADHIAALWWVMLGGSAIILMVTGALLGFALRGKGQVSDTAVRRWIVGGGIAFPITVLLALLSYGLVVGERLLPRSGADVMTVGAHAVRWQWVFTHRGADGGPIRSAHVLHIPVDRPVDVELTTGDVIHSFWVPRLAGKMDAIPGRTNVLRIEASEAGVYHGLCAEFCGPGHSRHGFRVIVHDRASWAAWRAAKPQ